MKSKKVFILFLTLFLIVVIGGYFLIQYLRKNSNNQNMQEYTPEQEISEDQPKQTIVTLYFQSTETKELTPEARMVDIKNMASSPYDTLINLLIDGPKSEKCTKLIPDNTKLNSTNLESDCLTVDFSTDFLNYDKSAENSKSLMVNSIVNTLTELTEVNKVKILIDGAENEEFKEIYERSK